MAGKNLSITRPLHLCIGYIWIAIGAFLAAIAIHNFLAPNHIIDGGIIGIAMIIGMKTSKNFIGLYFFILNLPFIFLAYKFIRRNFMYHMLFAVILFSLFLWALEETPTYTGDYFEIIVIGGAILGIGAGMIIRHGACLDGSEILGIIINKKKGFTIGQVVFLFNFFVFALYGILFWNWEYAIRSLLTYVVAFKMIDTVIMGLDEIKSVTIISKKQDLLVQEITNAGYGVTTSNGRGGYTSEDITIINVIVNRLDLSLLKELTLDIDENAFIMVSQLSEVVSGRVRRTTTT